MQFNAILFSLLMLVILSSSSFALPSEKESAWTNYWGDKSAHKPAASSESTQSTASKGKQEWQDVNQRPATSTYPTSYKSSQGETAWYHQPADGSAGYTSFGATEHEQVVYDTLKVDENLRKW